MQSGTMILFKGKEIPIGWNVLILDPETVVYTDPRTGHKTLYKDLPEDVNVIRKE